MTEEEDKGNPCVKYRIILDSIRLEVLWEAWKVRKTVKRTETCSLLPNVGAIRYLTMTSPAW